MAEAARALKARVLKLLRAVVPAVQPNEGGPTRDGSGRAPVYVPAKRGAPTRRGGDGTPRR
ncbi:hypothetical protein J5226_24570 [Lysobacter sp. K5869]|uniref:hypothetical protein n=1 Tax=Lysobacter sp. K5869 TaxID=2820808 RepID=UPI001C060758|nr:hypothetical protein [Lysobacter sp. K5869]QWP76709.1 hypothetical protein J5226_24570 [Lysobacter sp. K5869]